MFLGRIFIWNLADGNVEFQEHPLFECLIIGLMLMALIININKSKKFINKYGNEDGK